MPVVEWTTMAIPTRTAKDIRLYCSITAERQGLIMEKAWEIFVKNDPAAKAVLTRAKALKEDATKTKEPDAGA